MRTSLYNTNYEAGTIILITFLYIYLRVKYSNKSEINDALRHLVIAEQITIVFDLFSSATISFPTVYSLWLNVCANTVYFVMIGMTSCMMEFYLLAFIKNSRAYKGLLLSTKVFLFIYILFVVGNIWGGYIVSFPGGVYTHGPLYFVIYVLPFVYILFGIFMLIIFRRYFTRQQKILMGLIMAFAEVGPVMQAVWYPDVLLSNVSPALSLLLALFTVVSPNYSELVKTREELERREKSLSKEVAERTAEIVESTKKSDLLSKQIIASLAKIIDCAGADRSSHTENVAYLSWLIAKEMGIKGGRLYEIYCMGIVHDIGLVGIDETTLAEKGVYTPAQRAEMQKHSAIGAKILQNITEMPDIGIGAHWHHERYDGAGYPDGLVGEDIPLEARIIGVADAYDGMTQPRTYKEALSEEEAVEEFRSNSGTQFDPRVVRALTLLLKRHRYTPGMTVEEALLKIEGKAGNLR